MKTYHDLNILLADLRELTETNCHGEALELIAETINDKQMEKAFAAVNTLHSTFGYLEGSVSDLRRKLTQMLFERIKSKYGEETRKEIHDCL